MLSLTEILEYTLYREGAFLIPLDAFKLSMSRVETIFYNVVREYEAYVPLITSDYMYVTREGVHIPDAKLVKSLEITAGDATQKSIIKSMLRPINQRYWNFDKQEKLLTSQLDGHYLVKYIKYHTFEKLHYRENTGRPYRDQEEYTGKLKAEPDLKSLRFQVGNRVATYNKETDCNGNKIITYSGSLGDVHYNDKTREFTLFLDPYHNCEPVIAEYLTKYKGFKDLEIGDNTLLTDWFAAELYSSLGSLMNITQLEQSPVKWNVNDLLAYGHQLRTSVAEKKNSQMTWYAWIP